MLTLVAAAIVALVGAMILWSNPSRTVNRISFTCSLHVATWLFCLFLAVSTVGALFWLQTACATAAWVPFHYWLVKETIAGTFDWSARTWVRRCWAWILVSLLLTVICYTEAFIPAQSTPTNRIRGWGYYGYYAVVVCLYAYVFLNAYNAMRKLVGVRRIELQVWLGGGCAMAVTVLALMALNAVAHARIYILAQPLAIIAFYAAMVFTITTSRIFDAYQVLVVAAEKLLLVSLTATVAYVSELALDQLVPHPLDYFATTAIALWFASSLNVWLDRVFRFYPQATDARQAAFAAARSESRVEGLERAFLNVLKGWGQSDHALLLHGGPDLLRGGDVGFHGDSTIARSMRRLRWATPERLARERSSPEHDEVARFLSERQLGALVIGEGQTLTVLVGVGIPASRRPFTYPQVEQLMELASIIESALERAVFAAKAQHAEQLATVGLLGASLAHEIRNPLVTIKTFAQLLPENHQDPAFREKFFKLIGNEVGRIDRLTEQLLDLAAPRNYLSEPVQLHPLIKAGLDLVTAKAADRRIEFITELQADPDQVMTDPSAVKQVVLNLCFNAIQAVESRETERWVRLSTRNVDGGVEMAVSDNGPGISPEIRPRLFQPFQTTKSSGFGLGLAICSDILANVHATISVDPMAAGRGATFRVVFPCQPSSS